MPMDKFWNLFGKGSSDNKSGTGSKNSSTLSLEHYEPNASFDDGWANRTSKNGEAGGGGRLGSGERGGASRAMPVRTSTIYRPQSNQSTPHRGGLLLSFTPGGGRRPSMSFERGTPRRIYSSASVPVSNFPIRLSVAPNFNSPSYEEKLQQKECEIDGLKQELSLYRLNLSPIGSDGGEEQSIIGSPSINEQQEKNIVLQAQVNQLNSQVARLQQSLRSKEIECATIRIQASSHPAIQSKTSLVHAQDDVEDDIGFSSTSMFSNAGEGHGQQSQDPYDIKSIVPKEEWEVSNGVVENLRLLGKGFKKLADHMDRSSRIINCVLIGRNPTADDLFGESSDSEDDDKNDEKPSSLPNSSAIEEDLERLRKQVVVMQNSWELFHQVFLKCVGKDILQTPRKK